MAPWTGHPFDFEIWVRLGVLALSGANPYSLLPYIPHLSFAPYPLMTSISYPPFPAFIFAATYGVYQLVGSPSAFLYYFLLKQPMVFSDLLAAVLLFRLFSLKGDTNLAQKIAKLWIYLPLAIIVSAMWGALDPVALLLILGSLYAFEIKKPIWSAGLLGVAVYLKLMPIIFLPLFLFNSDFSTRKKAAFASIALIIPLLGTVLPFYLLGWNPSGIYNAVSYQGELPGFGGIGVFNAFSLLSPHTGVSTMVLSLVWFPALLAAYAYSYVKKVQRAEALLITVILFAIFRPTMPEQWAIYPIAFLLLLWNHENKVHAFALTGVATAYLAVNNFLLVRFFSPISLSAFNWDLMVDSASGVSELRYGLMLVLSAFFSAEALSIVLRRHSLLETKLKLMRNIRPGDVAVPIAYVAIISLAGGFLDFTATKMVTDWALAIQSSIFLGLSWLSLYHIMLVSVFEIMVLLIVLFSRRNLSDSISLFLLLTFLNFIASGFSLILYRAFEGAPILSTVSIYLAGSASVTERTFVVFASTLGLLGIFFLNEIRSLFLIIVRRTPQITQKTTLRPYNEDSLPSSP
ncbi:MAG TPA: glycosyltransferase 87 family protein [Nitrososphaerales archaeon]|nr:glycosyltransferase 87 family protein [Nitrososphaerales archaeon]